MAEKIMTKGPLITRLHRTLLTNISFPKLIISLQKSAIQSSEIDAVCYGNGKYVCGGESQWIHSSEDLITWKDGVYVGGSVYFIIWIDELSLYAACLSNGKIITSSDAITWATVTTLPAYIWAITYINGKLFACCKNGYVYYASGTDLHSWTQGTLQESQCVPTFVTFGNDQYIASNENGKIYRSVDGHTWTEAGQIPEKAMYVFFLEDRFIVYGNNGIVYESFDGMNLTELAQLAGGLIAGALIPFAGGTRLTAATQEVGGTDLQAGLIYISHDKGQSWELLGDLGYNIYRIAFGNGRLLIPCNKDMYSSQSITGEESYV